MPSAKTVYTELANFQKTINACLTRCDAAPFPSLDRENRIRAIREELANISQRAGSIYTDITKDAQAELLAKAAELGAEQAAVAASQEQQHTIQLNFNIESAELQRRQTNASGEQERRRPNQKGPNCRMNSMRAAMS